MFPMRPTTVGSNFYNFIFFKDFILIAFGWKFTARQSKCFFFLIFIDISFRTKLKVFGSGFLLLLNLTHWINGPTAHEENVPHIVNDRWTLEIRADKQLSCYGFVPTSQIFSKETVDYSRAPNILTNLSAFILSS